MNTVRGGRGRDRGVSSGERDGFNNCKSGQSFAKKGKGGGDEDVPPGFEWDAWNLFSSSTKRQVLELYNSLGHFADNIDGSNSGDRSDGHLQQHGSYVDGGATSPSHNNSNHTGKRKCYKCQKINPVGGGPCNYSKCGKFVCGVCSQFVPKRQKNGRRTPSGGVTTSAEEPGDVVGIGSKDNAMLLCSRCKPQVAYCRICLDLKEVPDLVHCYFCKRKLCKGCENTVLGKKSSKRHYHQCKSCANSNPESYAAWSIASAEYLPCKTRYCTDWENFEKVTELDNETN